MSNSLENSTECSAWMRFLREEAGAVTTDWAFMSSATMAVSIAVTSSLTPTPDTLSLGLVERLTGSDIIYRSQNFGRTRLEVMLDGEIERLSDTRTTIVWERFSNPAERTDAQVRNAHRTWSRRQNDPTYDQPARARDMVRILDNALAYRELEPHDDI